MDSLATLLQRDVIILLAVIGGVIATVGNILVQKKENTHPGLCKLILKFGYVITWTSVALFIATGFFGE